MEIKKSKSEHIDLQLTAAVRYGEYGHQGRYWAVIKSIASTAYPIRVKRLFVSKKKAENNMFWRVAA